MITVFLSKVLRFLKRDFLYLEDMQIHFLFPCHNETETKVNPHRVVIESTLFSETLEGSIFKT